MSTGNEIPASSLDILDAGIALNSELSENGRPDWLVAVAAGKASVIVYVTKVGPAKRVLPKSIQGVPVTVTRMGKVRPA